MRLDQIQQTVATPLCCVLHRANKHDSLTLKHTLETFERKVKDHVKYTSLLADKGYDASHCRSVCEQHDLTPCIPKRRTGFGYAPAPQGRLRHRLAKLHGARVFLVEWPKTSQMCCRCHGRLEKVAVTNIVKGRSKLIEPHGLRR